DAPGDFGSDRYWKELLERVPGAEEPALHGADRHADRIRDLLVRPVLDLAHDERNTVMLIHPADRLVDRLAQLDLVGEPLRVRPVRLELDRTGAGRLGIAIPSKVR